jgi:hypothetical protein
MTRSAAVVLVALIIAAAVTAVVWLTGRPPPPKVDNCIHPPALASEEQTHRANDLANTLKSAVSSSGKGVDSDSKFKAAFSDALKTQYDKLSDENATLYLFSQAIYCYLNLKSETGNRAAEQWTQMLIETHREKHHAQGAGQPLTLEERASLQSDPNGQKALELLDKMSK